MILGRFERGVTVPRVTNPDKEAFQDMEFFACWGTTVLATNVEIPVHEPLRSRCLKVTMPEARGNYPNNNSGEELADLKNRLTAFRARHFDKKLPEVGKPVAGRLGDIMQPLFYVAQLLPPEAKENLTLLIEEFEGERKQSESETLAGRIIQALFDLQGEVNNCQLPFERVKEKVNEGIEERYHTSPQKIGRELSILGIGRKKSHGVKSLIWESQKLNEFFKRYLPPENIVPIVPNVPQAGLTRVSEGDEFFQMSPASPEMSPFGNKNEKLGEDKDYQTHRRILKTSLSESLPKTSPASLEKAITEVCCRLNRPRGFKGFDFWEYCKKWRHSPEITLKTLLQVEQGLKEDAFREKDIWTVAVDTIKTLSGDNGDEGDDTKNNVPLANSILARDGDNGDNGDEFLTPRKNKFSPPVIEEILE